MGDRSGQIISTRVRVDHVASDMNGFGICYMLNVCYVVMQSHPTSTYQDMILSDIYWLEYMASNAAMDVKIVR